MSEPWAYIAHKDGHWAGVTQPGKGAGKFLADFINDGFAITTVHSRDEYEATLDQMKHWHEHPEYLAKKKPVSAHPDLFEAKRSTP